jgi:uncharacterized membrane protein YqiK
MTATNLITVRIAGSLTDGVGTYAEAVGQHRVPAIGSRMNQARIARDTLIAALRTAGYRGFQVTAYTSNGYKKEARS